jgi:hypothetical protein
MHSWSRLFVVSALASVPFASLAAAPVPASTPAAQAAMAEAHNALLQGDARRALQALAAVPAAQFGAKDAGNRACLFERFDRDAPPALSTPIHDVFVRRVIEAYRDHWWHALRAPAQRDALENRLFLRLRTLLAPAADGARDIEALKPALNARLRAAGYHALAGDRTLPLQELMIWRRQDIRDEQVELPDGMQRVRLEVLDDFAVRGWSHYARCGLGSAAGWATTEGVFAVRPAYDDLEGEEFKVSLLGHEAQHFSDYARFPGLLPWQLEYRAKLVELWMASQTQANLLKRFSFAQSDDPDSPHTCANRRVLQALKQRLPAGADLTKVPLPEIRAAALAALRDDSQRLRAAAP